MTAVFYTVLVVAIIYTLFSLFGWISVLIARQQLRVTINKYNKKYKYDVLRKKAPMPTLQIHWHAIVLDIITTIYWIWMTVRCFVD